MWSVTCLCSKLVNYSPSTRSSNDFYFHPVDGFGLKFTNSCHFPDVLQCSPQLLQVMSWKCHTSFQFLPPGFIFFRVTKAENSRSWVYSIHIFSQGSIKPNFDYLKDTYGDIQPIVLHLSERNFWPCGWGLKGNIDVAVHWIWSQIFHAIHCWRLKPLNLRTPLHGGFWVTPLLSYNKHASTEIPLHRPAGSWRASSFVRFSLHPLCSRFIFGGKAERAASRAPGQE